MELRAEEGFAQAAGWDEGEPMAMEETAAPDRVWHAVAAAVIVAWLALAAWLAWPRLGALDGVGLVQLLAATAVVPVLVAAIWLIAQRSSHAEARRFNDVARAMRVEAAELERSVSALSRAIDVNRSKLAEQVEALLAMSDAAAARLGSIRQDVGAEIGRVEEHARSLSEAATLAQGGVGALLAALPRTQEGVTEVARVLDRAGESAAEHASVLRRELVELADRSREADATASGSAKALAERIAEMDARSDSAGARLDAVSAQLAQTVDALVARTTATVDGARQGIAAQGEAMVAAVAKHQARLDHAARVSAEALAERIATVEDVIERISGRLDAQRASGDLIVEHLRTGIVDVEGRLNRLHAEGGERAQMLAASISALGGSADAMTEALKAGDAMATRTIGTTESLLIALDAATREIDETLPDALGRLDGRITATKRLLGEAKPELLALVTAAESTHDAIEAVAGVVADQRRTLDQLSGQLLETLGTGRAKAEALSVTVDETIDRTRRFADEAAPQMVQSLLRVRDSAAAAAENAREALASVVPDAVARLESAGTDALRRAASTTVERQIHALAQATEAAVDAAARAAERIAHEAQAIVERTAVVEAHIATAREERDGQERESLSRRVAGLIESLNSASIDVTKMLAPDVSDSAWAAYLKGDRGVFTRRAVRLLEGGDARDVARLYDADDGFRDATNRYIHDFEAMLRDVLKHPDGQPLSITLLSSDMGKLYVALAQAIERLR
ncbi:MAG TPA: hypothetical protein VF636_00340 [Sphingomonas sp.]